MKKKILGLTLSAAMILSSLPAYAKATLSADGVYFDDFGTGTNATSEWYESANANLDANPNNTKPISSGERASVENEALKLTAVDGAKNAFYVIFENPVTGNLKVSFKIKIKNVDDFLYVSGASQNGSNDKAQQYLFALRLLKSENVVTAGVWHPYNGPDKFIDTSNNQKQNNALAWTEDTWYSVEVDFNTEETTKTYKVKVNGIESSAANLDNTNWGGLTRFGFKMSCVGEVAIDDFQVKQIIPLQLSSANIENNEVNVKVDKKFELNFQKAVDTATIKNITLAKKNDPTDSVACTVTSDSTEKKVTVSPNAELESLTEYVLTVPTTVQSKDEQPLKTAVVYNFTTEYVSDYSINNAAFTNGVFSAEITSKADAEANARVTVYETVNGKKRYLEDFARKITLNSINSFEFTQTVTTELPENYVVSLSLLDDDLKPLCSEAAFDKNGAVTEKSADITTEENTVDYSSGVVKVAQKLGTTANVYSAVEVKNENGGVIYFDQIMTGADGSSEFEFVPKKGVTAASYQITLNSTALSEKETYSLAVDYSQFTVSVTKPGIKGTLAADEEIEADYTYSSVIGDAEGATAYEWLLSSDGVTYNPISGAASKKYTLKDSDENQYIKVKVTPKSALGQATGAGMESDPVLVKTLPKALNVSISGSATVGGLLTGSYTYSHKNGVTQNGSVYEWLISDTVNGTYSSVGNGLTYSVRNADAGKYIKFRVTPKCDVEPKEGKTVETAATYVSAGGGGGGGGSSGSSIGGGFVGTGDYKNPEVVTPEEENKEDENKAVFGDIEGHWASSEIKKLYEKGIVTGDEKGNFNPEANVTRAEFTAMMVRLLGLDSQKYISMFADVDSKAWYADIIATAVAYGIVSGDGDSFRPTDGISREEMAVILIRAYEKKIGAADSGEVSATDRAKISQWALEAVEKAWSMGLINGFEDGSFAPQDSVTRAQAAVVMVRLLEYIEEV